jgi:hypothetical protein
MAATLGGIPVWFITTTMEEVMAGKMEHNRVFAAGDDPP